VKQPMYQRRKRGIAAKNQRAVGADQQVSRCSCWRHRESVPCDGPFQLRAMLAVCMEMAMGEDEQTVEALIRPTQPLTRVSVRVLEGRASGTTAELLPGQPLSIG